MTSRVALAQTYASVEVHHDGQRRETETRTPPPPGKESRSFLTKQREAWCVQLHDSASNADVTPLRPSFLGPQIKGSLLCSRSAARSLRVRGEFGLREGIRSKQAHLERPEELPELISIPSRHPHFLNLGRLSEQSRKPGSSSVGIG